MEAGVGGTGDGVVRLGHQRALTGLRGLAVVMVLLQHLQLGPVRNGRGVDLFIVLSGFLITTLLLEERAGTGAIALRPFVVRRLERLYPALIAMVAVVTVVFIAAGPSGWHDSTLNGSVLAVTFLANLAVGVWRQPIEPFGHTWSLALEAQFYVVWPPILAAICVCARGRAKVLVGAIVALIVVAAVGASTFYAVTRDDTHLYMNLDGRGVQLLLDESRIPGLSDRPVDAMLSAMSRPTAPTLLVVIH